MPNISRLLIENVQPPRGRQGWHGGPTSSGALRGVDEVQARWRPGANRRSIWELTLHIAYWTYAVRRRLLAGRDRSAPSRFGRSPANWPRLPEPADAAAWAADVALLRLERERLVEACASVPVSALDDRPPGSRRWTYGELIVGIAQHDAYHTGQLQLVKRLWQERRTTRA